MYLILKIILMIMCFSVSCYSQYDSSNLIHCSHKKINVYYYKIDGLVLKAKNPEDGLYLFGKNKAVHEEILAFFKFKDGDVKEYLLKNDTCFIKTKLIIALDSIILDKNEEKEKYLSSIKQNEIISIERLDKDEAIKQYGKLGKKGIVIIKTKRE